MAYPSGPPAPVSRNETLSHTAGLGSAPRTCVMQQVGSHLGYSGRDANAFEKATHAPPAPTIPMRLFSAPLLGQALGARLLLVG